MAKAIKHKVPRGTPKASQRKTLIETARGAVGHAIRVENDIVAVASSHNELTAQVVSLRIKLEALALVVFDELSQPWWRKLRRRDITAAFEQHQAALTELNQRQLCCIAIANWAREHFWRVADIALTEEAADLLEAQQFTDAAEQLAAAAEG